MMTETIVEHGGSVSIETVVKRDGTTQKFNQSKILNAISKAVASVEAKEVDIEKVTKDVVAKLKDRKQAHVEEIQDLVEQTLVKHNLYGVAKSYILHRKKRTEIRKAARMLGIKDAFHLPLNSLYVLASRYLQRDEHGEIKEQPRELFERVAKAIAQVDYQYGATEEEVRRLEQQFFDAMTKFEFLPNSPTLMNAGTGLGQLAACFVLPVGDSIEEIYDSVKWAALVHKSGGGTGFSFSKLRPKGDVVQSTSGIASGVVTFMKVFNASTDVIKQGGKRRGANIGILHVTHPDILDFVTAKAKEGEFTNFNISVGITDAFMEALLRDDYIWLINPRNNKKIRQVKARVIWDLLIHEAWKAGDPACVFLDTINKSTSNCVPKFGRIEATNPCGEIPLYPFEACNLLSINLSKCVKDDKTDWERLKYLVHLGVRFLDNVIDANKYPIPQIENMVKQTRRIGLGVMGFADLLILLGVPYNSEAALQVAEKVMAFIQEEGHKASQELGEKRGNFPAFEDSIWNGKRRYMRNCCVTAVVPTGTTSIIAGGCSSGVEPLFSVAYVRRVRESLGTDLFEVNPQFEKIAVRRGFYSDELVEKVARNNSIQKINEIPDDVKKVFVTAHGIGPEYHVRMQAAFQKYVDNAISKTINFPEWATPHDVEKAFMLAWRLGCKGITIYRDKSKRVQVLSNSCECENCSL